MHENEKAECMPSQTLNCNRCHGIRHHEFGMDQHVTCRAYVVFMCDRMPKIGKNIIHIGEIMFEKTCIQACLP